MFYRFILKRKKKRLEEKAEKKFEMKIWMNLTKEERLELDLNEKNKTMRKKKALLKSIREEYIKLKKKK